MTHIFFNLQLNLDNPGDTNRRPGKFIDVFKLETDLLPMLLEMRQKGVRIDTQKASQLEIEYEHEIDLAQAKLEKLPLPKLVNVVWKVMKR